MKLLYWVAARDRVGEALDAAVLAEARRWAGAQPGAMVTALRQLPGDVFAQATPHMRPYDATIEVTGESLDADALTALVQGAAGRLDAVAHPDLSGVLVGRDHVVIACEPTPTRYQYGMRRRSGSTREQYLDHYVNRHARFGLVTPGIEGYVQFHVDPDASRTAAAAAGAGTWGFDSVSELHLASLDTFLTALATDNPATDAIEDEERFVDRPNSVSFTSDVLLRHVPA